MEIPRGWGGLIGRTIRGGGMDIFWNHTMTGNSTSAQLITIGVDIGSNIQLFFGKQPINLLTALSVKGIKLSSVLVGNVFT